MTDPPPTSTRREFLTAAPLRDALQAAAEAAAVPIAGNTIRLGKAAMASDFEVILNPGSTQLAAASDALDEIDRLEDQLSIYRPHSELSRINASAALGPVVTESRLLALLQETLHYAELFDGAYDPTAGPLVALWRLCRRERRVPSTEEVEAARSRLGFREVVIEPERETVRFLRPGIELNLNAIGKGYALDRAAEVLLATRSTDDESDGENAVSLSPPTFLLHGGYSSILARGGLTGLPGWPIAIRHPLVPNRTLATLILRDRAMSTSGSAVQFFRVGNRRYGHILDPRTGWPAEAILSVTVLAPTAARAEALSTAFFVAGVEKAREYCHNHTDVAALIVPAPASGQRLEPVNCGIAETDLLWESED